MIRLHDTMARAKRDFTPADPARVTMYACGPTVYARAHIGNARPAVVFDLLARLLRHDYGAEHVVYARNVTDWDDKIAVAADAEGVAYTVITQRYERTYLEDMGAIGVSPPDVAPRATEHVDDMIAMTASLIEAGHAYVAQGHVLFDVSSDPSYGSLSRLDREGLEAGARVEVAPYKRGAADFVLWKPSSADQVGWESPWSRGRPGWHIECSAMIERHLGATIDIHAGGMDLAFPHHENECAQSRCAHGGAALARFWLHNGFLTLGGDKMSKSAGRLVTVKELLDAGHRGEVIRLALLSAGYRQPLEWSDDLLIQARARLDGLYERVEHVEVPGEVDGRVLDALRDDLATPAALAALSAIENPADLLASANLMGLLAESPEAWLRGGDDEAEIQALVDRRWAARQARDWAGSDAMRDELAARGIEVRDGKDGSTWTRRSGGAA